MLNYLYFFNIKLVTIGIGLAEESFDDVKEKVIKNAFEFWVHVKYEEAHILPPLIRDKSSIVRNYLLLVALFITIAHL